MDIIERAGALSCKILNYESLGVKTSKLNSQQQRIDAKAKILKDNMSNIELPFVKNKDVEKMVERSTRCI